MERDMIKWVEHVLQSRISIKLFIDETKESNFEWESSFSIKIKGKTENKNVILISSRTWGELDGSLEIVVPILHDLKEGCYGWCYKSQMYHLSRINDIKF